MASLYIICLIVGGGLLLVSTLFSGSGTGDVDVDGTASADFSGDVSPPDFNHDLSHHGPHHDVAPLKGSSPLSLANWFSMQFVVYFRAALGLVGPECSPNRWRRSSPFSGSTFASLLAESRKK